jgi:tetratricopeptide (TPR) repeat protein
LLRAEGGQELGYRQWALADLDRAIQLDPKLAAAYSQRGLLLVESLQPAEALVAFDKAVELEPDVAIHYLRRGQVLVSQGDQAKALDDFSKAIDRDPTLAQAYTGRGKLRLSAKDVDKALDDLDRAVEMAPSDVDARVLRGQVRREKKYYEDSLSDFDKAIELSPRLADAFKERGLTRLTMGKPEQAKLDFAEAGRLRPSWESELNRLLSGTPAQPSPSVAVVPPTNPAPKPEPMTPKPEPMTVARVEPTPAKPTTPAMPAKITIPKDAAKPGSIAKTVLENAQTWIDGGRWENAKRALKQAATFDPTLKPLVDDISKQIDARLEAEAAGGDQVAKTPALPSSLTPSSSGEIPKIPAGPWKFASPLNVSVEIGKIYSAFNVWQLPPASRTGPEFEKFIAARDEKFGQLALAADAAKSTEYPALLEVNILANRPTSALAAFNGWLAQDVAPADAEKYLALVMKPASNQVEKLVRLLIKSGEITVATQAQNDFEVKVRQFEAYFDKIATPQTFPPKVGDAVRSIDSLRSEVEKAETEAYSKATLPIQFYFARPLNVRREWLKIAYRFHSQSGNQSSGPVYEVAEAKRMAAIHQLLAAAEAARSAEHLPLSWIYRDLGRLADAEREAQTAVKADATDVAAQNSLFTILNRMDRAEDALKQMREFLALNLPVARADEFLRYFPSDVLYQASKLADAEKFVESEQLLNQLQSQIDNLKGQLEKSPATYRQTLAIATSAQTTLNDKRKDIARQKSRWELVGKPYIPITDAVWLNGAALRPEDLKGKVVLIEFFNPGGLLTEQVPSWRDKYGPSGLLIVGAARLAGEGAQAERSKTTISDFARQKGLQYAIAALPDKTLLDQYFVDSFPQVVLVDRQGAIRKIKVGKGDAISAELETGIRQALGLKN